MLINCPRCDFQQPQDQYCAQCGVDIDAFRPAAVPLWKKIFSNLFVQIALLLIVAGGAGISVYQKEQDNLERRVAYLNTAPQVASTSGSPQDFQATENDDSNFPSTNELPTDQASQTPSEGNVTLATAKMMSNETTAPVPTSPSAASSTALVTNQTDPKPQLIIKYAEVSRQTLSNFVSLSRATGQFMSFNEYSAGILPGMMKALSSAGVRTLAIDKSNAKVNPGTFYESFVGISDPTDLSRRIGFNLAMAFTDIEDGVLRGNIELQRYWRELRPPGEPQVQRRDFPAIFEIGRDSGFFIFGMLPRRTNLDNREDELIRQDVFKILRSPQFQSEESEFVIFIEFNRDNRPEPKNDL